MEKEQPKWDAFISHASEDKDAFVRPLAKALSALGANVWYDEFSLKIGDSLSESIDHGLVNSSYGIVVLSPSFISKPWPKRELQGLVAREIGRRSAILPIWHQVSHDDILNFSPPLADKVAVRTADMTAEKIALQILSVVRPSVFAEQTYEELKAIASGDALGALRDELKVTKEQLEEFLCPVCGSRVVEVTSYPADPGQKHWGESRTYECGHVEDDGQTRWLCPDDENFPSVNDFDYEVYAEPEREGTDFAFTCNPIPKTKYACKIFLSHYPGRTKEEAVAYTKGLILERGRNPARWHNNPDFSRRSFS